MGKRSGLYNIPIHRNIRNLLQGGKCYYCRCTLLFHHDQVPETHPRRANREHKIPKCRGGANKQNIVLACVACNMRKGTMTDKEYKNYLWQLNRWSDVYDSPANTVLRLSMFIQVVGDLYEHSRGETEGLQRVS